MPHCVLEYSSNVADQPDFSKLLLELNTRLGELGLFPQAHIKSRAVEQRAFVVAEGDPSVAFVALDIAILDGRSDAEKARISETALAVLEAGFPATLAGKCSITVRVSDIHRASYRKRGQV